MTLYQKGAPGSDPLFVEMTPEAEAAARADASSRFGNESGYPILFTPDQAAEIVATQAAIQQEITAAVPRQVSMAQARISLFRGLPGRANILAEVQTLVSGIGGETQLWWDHATIVERNNAIVNQLAAALSPPLSSADVDSLFTVAASIV